MIMHPCLNRSLIIYNIFPLSVFGIHTINNSQLVHLFRFMISYSSKDNNKEDSNRMLNIFHTKSKLLKRNIEMFFHLKSTLTLKNLLKIN